MGISRREFVRSAAGVAAVGAAGGVIVSQGQESATRPAEGRAARGGPVFVGSLNARPACTRALERLRAGADILDAIVDGVNLVENDPDDNSVGYGGLPNEDGVVELDASVMHGPTHKAAGVAALQRIKNPSSVALRVLWRTDHVLLVGEGAFKFARAHGFPEENLLTEKSRETWLKWRESRSGVDDWLTPEEGGKPASRPGARRFPADSAEFTWGTINCLGLTAGGDLAGCTSTSGLSYKLAGRVGDSPIIGAGLYVDNEIGAAGSTGRGEANLQNLTSFTVVELMRFGMTPTEACKEALRRVAKHTEKRLLNAKGEPDYGLSLYALRKDGMWGGAVMRGTGKMAVLDGAECRAESIEGLFADG